MVGTFIQFNLRGFKETSQFLNRMKVNTPKAGEEIAGALATDVQRGARFRLSNRTKKRTGRLWQSILAKKTGKAWTVFAGGMTAPYASEIEAGQQITGWRFIARRGYGKTGEGYMIPGGQHVIHPTWFFRDAVNSTIARSGRIADRRLSRLLKTGR